MRLIYRPIGTWPGQRTKYPKSSLFNSTWSETLQLLDRELHQLNVTEAVLQVDSATERDFRLDGQLCADARLRSGAVILSFETRKTGKLSFPCDTFTAVPYRKLEGWQVNVRAIALGLEALRKLDRYGITNTGQQYTGWKQLGAGIPLEAPKMTVEEAAAFMASHAGDANWAADVIGDPEMRKVVYRDAARRLHPDVGGDPALFRKLNDARDLLDRAS